MKKLAKPKRDFMEVARCVVEQAIGEQIDGSPLVAPVDLRNPYAVAIGQLGGKKGGKTRAERLTSARRIEIAKQGAEARWKKT